MPRPNRFNPGTLNRLSSMRSQQRRSRSSSRVGQSLNDPRLSIGYYEQDDRIPVICNRVGLSSYRELEARVRADVLLRTRVRERSNIRQTIGIDPASGDSRTGTGLTTDLGRSMTVNSASEIVNTQANSVADIADALTSDMLGEHARPTLEKQPKYRVVNTDEIDKLIDEEIGKAIKESTKEWLRTVGRRAVLKHFTVHPTPIEEVSNVTQSIQKHVARGFPLCNIAFSMVDLNLFRRVIRYLEHGSTKVNDPSRMSYKNLTEKLLPAFEKEQKRLIEERERQEFIASVWRKRVDRGFLAEFEFDNKDYAVYSFRDALDFRDEHIIQHVCLDKHWYYQRLRDGRHIYLSVMDCERQKAVLSLELSLGEPRGPASIENGKLTSRLTWKIKDIKSSKNINPIKYAELARHLECVLGIPGIGEKYINGMQDPDAHLRFNPRFLDDLVALTTDHLIRQQQESRLFRPGHDRSPPRLYEYQHVSALEAANAHSQYFPVDGTIETRGL